MKAIVIGGEGGIGSAIVHQLRQKEMDVQSFDISGVPENYVDISSIDSVRKMIDCIGSIDAVINAAGLYRMGFFTEIPYEDHSQLIDVVVKGPLHVYTSFLAAHKQEWEQGNKKNLEFIDINALTSFTPYGGNAVSAGAKAFYRMMSTEIGLEAEIVSTGQYDSEFHHLSQITTRRVYCDSVDTGIYASSEGNHAWIEPFPMMPPQAIAHVVALMVMHEPPYLNQSDISVEIDKQNHIHGYARGRGNKHENKIHLEELPWKASLLQELNQKEEQ